MILRGRGGFFLWARKPCRPHVWLGRSDESRKDIPNYLFHKTSVRRVLAWILMPWLEPSLLRSRHPGSIDCTQLVTVRSWSGLVEYYDAYLAAAQREDRRLRTG